MSCLVREGLHREVHWKGLHSTLCSTYSVLSSRTAPRHRLLLDACNTVSVLLCGWPLRADSWCCSPGTANSHCQKLADMQRCISTQIPRTMFLLSTTQCMSVCHYGDAECPAKFPSSTQYLYGMPIPEEGAPSQGSTLKDVPAM